MKLKIKILTLLLPCLLLAGCANAVDVAKGAVESEKTYQEMKEYAKDAHVHSEEEMCDFALSCLKKKYGEDFAIDKSYYDYDHFNGHTQSSIMELRTKAYPVNDPDKVFALYVMEPNTFKDNYFQYRYKDDIAEIIAPEMEKYGLTGDFVINYPLLQGTVNEAMTSEQFLYASGTELCFYIPVEELANNEDYIPEIRKWLSYLYTCDYDWYFALCKADDTNFQYFGTTKGDNGVTSYDEVTDEMLLQQIETSIEMSNYRLYKNS